MSTDNQADEHGPLYWMVVHTRQAIWRFVGGHWRGLTAFVVGVLSLLYLSRAVIQPSVVAMRVYSFDAVLVLMMLFVIWSVQKRQMTKRAYLVALVLSAAIVLPHDYITLYLRYVFLDKELVTSLPETAHERIQPLNSIRVMINKEFMSRNEQTNDPYNVRGFDGGYRWTAGVEPLNLYHKVFGGVTRLVNISSTEASPDLSESKSRVEVSFPVGEHLLLGKNSKTCTILSFGLFRFLSYEPADVKYLEESKGKWVQVVSLTKWKGVIWPQPVFGGVQIIRQSDGGVLHYLKTLLVGEGEWVTPEDIGKYEFLKGQNLVPYKVSRYLAESFRFHSGFFAPLPYYHDGDVRIPDLPGDANDQPFTTCFKLDNGEEKLFHYFAMEPYAEDKHGLSLSILAPADGLGKVFVCDHNLNGDSMLGVSSVGGQVKSSDRHIDWTHSQPAEHRPFVRKILGKNRLLWFSSVVTYSKNLMSKNGPELNPEDYQSGGTPDVLLTEPHKKIVIKVDASHSEGWGAQVEKELLPYWNGSSATQ
jgi:hypothetical protein